MNTQYTCSMRGDCEPDPDGLHSSLERCQAACSPVSQRDLLLLIYQHNLGDAALLAPSDRGDLLYALVGQNFPPQNTRAILQGLNDEDALPLLDSSALVTYAERIWGPVVLRTALLNSGDQRALGHLGRTLRQLSNAEREQFARAALFAGNETTVTTLYNSGLAALLRSLQEVYLQPCISFAVLRVMFERDGAHLSHYLQSAVRQGLDNFISAALATEYTSPDEVEELGGRRGDSDTGDDDLRDVYDSPSTNDEYD
jgi:hypothetical protein